MGGVGSRRLSCCDGCRPLLLPVAVARHHPHRNLCPIIERAHRPGVGEPLVRLGRDPELIITAAV